MISITNPPSELRIGYVGENNFRTIQFDVSEWLKAHPAGTISIVFSRPDGEIYPVAAGITVSPAEWKPTTADLAVPGLGFIEIRIIDGDVIGKSCKIATCTISSLGSTGDPPLPPTPDWVQEAIESAPRAETAEQGAQAAEASAQLSAASAASNASASRQSAQAASDSAASLVVVTDNAAAAQRDADRAETARDRAEAAAIRQPVIGDNSNWWVWDSGVEAFVDSGVPATGPRGYTGANLAFEWDDTALGVRVEGDQEYQYVNLKGDKGDAGTPSGFGAPTATANTLAAGESATAAVVASGDATAKIFAFTFGVPQGLKGYSAYDQAVTGGYTDTEAAFLADLAAIEGLAAELEALL